MRSKTFIFAHNYKFPLKNKNAIVLIKTEHPDYLYEAYNYLGIFLSYLGKKELI
jgi:hypothetical protein